MGDWKGSEDSVEVEGKVPVGQTERSGGVEAGCPLG